MAAIQIQTPRLVLFPLTEAQLHLYLDASALEVQLGLTISQRQVSEELRDAIENTLIPAAQQHKSSPVYTLWTAVDKTHNMMVGDISLCVHKDTEEEIEIGYGTYDQHQNKGYMTEMIAGILDWLETQNTFSSVIATTAETNYPSHKVLIKNKFYTADVENGLIFWRRIL